MKSKIKKIIKDYFQLRAKQCTDIANKNMAYFPVGSFMYQRGIIAQRLSNLYSAFANVFED